MRPPYLLLCLLLCSTVPAVAGAAQTAPSGQSADDSALNDADQESLDAARLQSQELKSREQALEQQQQTTKTLLDKQQQYLDDLQKQIQQLKQHDEQAKNAHRSN